MDNYFPTSYNISSRSSSFSSAPDNAKDNRKKKLPTKKGNSNGVRLSTDPQSVAARERRHRISDRFKILQSLVPGGTKMDTVSMLEEAINYVKFLKTQILLHQTIMNFVDEDASSNPLSRLPQDCEVPNCQDYYYYYPCLETNIVAADQQPAMSLPVPDHSCFQEGGGDQEAQPYYSTFMNN